MIQPLVRRALLASVLTLLPAAGALAQRTPGPSGPDGVRRTSMTAEVRIVDEVATTMLNHVLHNDRAAQAEAIWILPLPEGAVADGFTMKVGGVEFTVEPEVPALHLHPKGR